LQRRWRTIGFDFLLIFDQSKMAYLEEFNTDGEQVVAQQEPRFLRASSRF
jgi:hypothetical protein